jgi:hypothetical protein
MNKKHVAVQPKQMDFFSGQKYVQAVTVWVTPWDKEISVHFQNHHDGQAEHK